MRFDDTLETVLAADLSTPYGVQSAWRQLVDLIGRRRAPADQRAMATLRAIRSDVPAPVRAASARALEYANPPAPLVRLFALDDLPIALPVLRSARLASAEWIQLLPDLAPAARQLLRNRRDLSPLVKRALESFGPTDFVLPDESVKEPAALAAEPEASVEMPVVEAEEAPQEEPIYAAEPEPEPEPEAPVEVQPAMPELLQRLFDAAAPYLEQEVAEPAVEQPIEQAADPVPVEEDEAPDTFDPVAETTQAAPEEEDFSFVALAGVAAALPVVDAVPVGRSEVVSPPVQSGTVEAETPVEAIAPLAAPPQVPAMDQGDTILAEVLEAPAPAHDREDAGGEGAGPFEIAEVVARIDAFWRHREEKGPMPPSAPLPATQFRFETDAKGVIRWVEGASRAPLVGLSLDLQGMPDGSRVDGVAAGAFRSRAGFSNARMWIEGESDASGDWRISAIPVFDSANGRFTGYRGTARRPRADERAEPARPAPGITPADSLRQLVHELRTPTNAIAGFAEMIETQMLGPVSDPYRDRAHVIRAQARELLGAIDDLDLAARIDSAALALIPDRVALRPLLAGIADDLGQLLELRGSMIALPIDDLAVSGDRRAVERLLARLLATLVSASATGERIGVRVAIESDDKVAVSIDRPRALADYPGDSVLGIDDEREDATLLGTGFALRLARNLARELGGSLVIEPDTLTLRLPASVNSQMGQAHLS